MVCVRQFFSIRMCTKHRTLTSGGKLTYCCSCCCLFTCQACVHSQCAKKHFAENNIQRKCCDLSKEWYGRKCGAIFDIYPLGLMAIYFVFQFGVGSNWRAKKKKRHLAYGAFAECEFICANRLAICMPQYKTSGYTFVRIAVICNAMHWFVRIYQTVSMNNSSIWSSRLFCFYYCIDFWGHFLRNKFIYLHFHTLKKGGRRMIHVFFQFPYFLIYKIPEMGSNDFPHASVYVPQQFFD